LTSGGEMGSSLGPGGRPALVALLVGNMIGCACETRVIWRSSLDLLDTVATVAAAELAGGMEDDC